MRTKGSDSNGTPLAATVTDPAPGSIFRSTVVCLWIALCVVGPAVLKFPPPSFAPRYGPHTWAMYGRATLYYTVEVFERDEENRPRAIPNARRYMSRLQSPGPALLWEHYYSEAQVEERYRLLLLHISSKGGDRVYEGRIRWQQTEREPRQDWTFRARRGAAA